MSQCLCLKQNGQQCQREVSTKIQDNPQFCWQHQNCKKQISTKKTKPESPMKKTHNGQDTDTIKRKTKPKSAIKQKPSGQKKGIVKEKTKSESSTAEKIKAESPIKKKTKPESPVEQKPHDKEGNLIEPKSSIEHKIIENKTQGIIPFVLTKEMLYNLPNAEKMDGDLSKLFYPPTRMDEILPQVLDIMYRMPVEYNRCYTDTKINNFLWKETDKGIKVYLADLGKPHQCETPTFGNMFGLDGLLADNIITFFASFAYPYEHGIGVPGEKKPVWSLLNDDKYKEWVLSVKKSLKDTMEKDKRWSGVDILHSVLAWPPE